MIVNEENLLDYIKNYLFISEEYKNNLIEKYYRLSEDEIKELINYFNDERMCILNFLKSFKSKNVCTFNEIKTELDNKIRAKIKLEEYMESEEDREDFLNILDSIDNL